MLFYPINSHPHEVTRGHPAFFFFLWSVFCESDNSFLENIKYFCEILKYDAVQHFISFDDKDYILLKQST